MSSNTLRALLIGLLVGILALIGLTWHVLYGRQPAAENLPVLVDRSDVWFADEKEKRLQVPKLGIDAKIETVGVTAEGNMASPSTFHTVAWYKGGTAPGGIGSAVIAGHVDNALSVNGVFKELHTLVPGDEVLVQTETAGTLRYRVVALEEYDYLNAPLKEIFDRNDGQYLNLVTCAGTWLSDRGTYDKRLIVYTELVPEG